MGGSARRDVVRPLLSKEISDEVRVGAVFALGAVGGSSDLPILDRALTDKKGLVRNRAVEAIVRIKDAQSS
jgi:HEAT repeat protein